MLCEAQELAKLSLWKQLISNKGRHDKELIAKLILSTVKKQAA